MQHLNALDTTEILQRRRKRCTKAARIVLPNTVNEKNNILRTIDIEFGAVIVSCWCILIDRNPGHIAQSLHQISVVTALDILARNHRDIRVCPQFLVGRSRRRDNGLSKCMLIRRVIVICRVRLPPSDGQGTKGKRSCHSYANTLLHRELLLKFHPTANKIFL